ncbi:DNA-binding IclR family transcriptional regulator [Rhodococcus sp. OK519]|uniref:IclR family transcriptional regulator n=1 Tax=Rhodococcus sp. OK519 TaxID=2135729 RepID=UPI000D37CF7C|nr:DNA-binding IclR family transcriptional regulator [Rhodococcus sp. OK519]
MTLHDLDTVPNTVLDRVELVLGALAGAGGTTVADVVGRTGIPRSSAHRLMERLVQLGWLRRDGHGYGLGLAMLELGTLAIHQDPLRATALPHLHELHRKTRLMVHLAVLDGDDVIYLDKIGGPRLESARTRVGGRSPARESVIGQALIANTSAEGIDSDRIRERGFVIDRGAATGYGAIGAVVGPTGSRVGISISGPRSHLHFDPRHVFPLRSAANAIWRAADPAIRTRHRWQTSLSHSACRA